MISINNNNFSLDEIMRLAKAAESKKPEDMLGAMKNNISDDKMSEIKRVLADKKALEQLLSSEQAQRLIKQFKKGN